MEALKIDRDVQIPVPSWAPKLAGENGEEVVSLRNALLRLYDLRFYRTCIALTHGRSYRTPKTKLFTLIQQHLRSGKGEMMHSNHTVGPKLKGNGGLHDSGQSICDLQHATEQQVSCSLCLSSMRCDLNGMHRRRRFWNPSCRTWRRESSIFRVDMSSIYFKNFRRRLFLSNRSYFASR